MWNLLFILVAGVVIYWLFLRPLLKRPRRGRDAAPTTGDAIPIGDLGDGNGAFLFDIVGESKYQNALESICGGRTEDGAEKEAVALLHLEDSNPFDNQAVRVEIEGRTVGYLSRGSARNYRKQMTHLGYPQVIGRCNALIVGGWYRSSDDQGHYGVRLDLPVN